MRRAAFVAMLLAFTAAGPALAARCRAQRGQRVELFGGMDDPDILVWDTRDRLLEYAAGSADTRRFLIPHALLVRPGTQAIVQECRRGEVRERFQFDADDAVGIRLTSGRYRGRYGWVSGADVRTGDGSSHGDPW